MSVAGGRLSTQYREGDREVLLALDPDPGRELDARDRREIVAPELPTRAGREP